MKIYPGFVILAALALLAACGSDPQAPDNATDNVQAPMAPIATPTPDASGSPDPDPTPSATPRAQSSGMPAAYHGEWDRRREDCGVAGSETRVRIEANRILFYESVGAVLDVAGAPPRIVVRAHYEGEGERWENSRTFTLSADGQTLNAEGMIRVRCP